MARITAEEPEVPQVLLEPPDHLSFSQLANLVPEVVGNEWGCSRKWAYERRLGLPFEAGPMLGVGKAVDAGVMAFLASRMAVWDLDTAVIAASTFAGQAYDESGLGEPYHRVVAEALQAVLDHVTDLVPADVQRRHEFTVRTLDGRRARRTIGFSDWIRPDGTIVDLKVTGSAKWNGGGWDSDWVAEKRCQLAGYWASRLAEERRGEPQPAPVVPRGELVVCYHNTTLRQPQLRVLPLQFDPGDLARVLEAVRLGDQRMVGGVYPARPGRACITCSFLGRCRDDERQRARPFAEVCGIPEAV